MLRNNTLSRADLSNDRKGILDIHYGDVLIRYRAVVDVSTLQGPFINITDNRFLGDQLTDGDIIMADTAEDTSAGKCVEIEGVMHRNVVAGLHTIPLRPATPSSHGYWGQYLNSASFRNQLFSKMQGTKVISLSRTTVSNATVRYPSLPEQRRIGDFFTILDNLIAAAERQETILRQKKQAYLQLMFPREGETEPRLRFAGFSGEWERHQLGELYAPSREKNDGSFSAKDIISVAGMRYAPRESAGSTDDYMKTYNVMKVGDIAFEGHSSPEFEFGRFVENDLGDGIVSHVFVVLRPLPGRRYDLAFWKEAIHDEFLMRRTLARSTKRSTMMHEIVVPDFLKETIRVPALPEQQKIGKFFTTLDFLISISRQRVESLQNAKNAYLQKMFF
jgi:type I restriction enzyme S subunit